VRTTNRSDDGRTRAEALFEKREQQKHEGEQAWAEHLAAKQAADAQRAQLRALRLSKEAADPRQKQQAHCNDTRAQAARQKEHLMTKG
jgi:hypothetical protein